MAFSTQIVEEGMRNLGLADDRKPVVPPQDQAGHVTPQNQVKHGEEKPEVKKEESGKINNANVVGVQPEAWEEKLAKDLTVEKVDEISAMLDSESTVVKNWYYLAILLGFNEDETNAMRRDGIGGGHPARDFLIHFQSDNQEETVKDFIKKVRKMKRNDIGKFLEKLESNKKIRDLSEDVVDKLAEMLTCRGGVVKDWKYLASLCDYDHDQIQEFASRKATDAQYSPTKALFQKLRASKPDAKLGDLVKVLGDKMSRWDVVRKLQSFYDN